MFFACLIIRFSTKPDILRLVKIYTVKSHRHLPHIYSWAHYRRYSAMGYFACENHLRQIISFGLFLQNASTYNYYVGICNAHWYLQHGSCFEKFTGNFQKCWYFGTKKIFKFWLLKDTCRELGTSKIIWIKLAAAITILHTGLYRGTPLF